MLCSRGLNGLKSEVATIDFLELGMTGRGGTLDLEELDELESWFEEDEGRNGGVYGLDSMVTGG